MSQGENMKTNSDYVLREIAGEPILVPTGMASQKINGMIRLTETAAFIWKQIDNSTNLEDIVEKVLQEYDASEESASRDVRGFMYELYIRDIVQDVPEFTENSADEK